MRQKQASQGKALNAIKAFHDSKPYFLFMCRIRIVACAARWIDSNNEWCVFFFSFCKLDDSYNLRTFIIYSDFVELEVKFDSCNSKMENNCFSDNFIGRQHILLLYSFSYTFRVELKSTNQIVEWKKRNNIYVYSERVHDRTWIEWRALDMKLVQFLFVIEFDLLVFGIFFPLGGSRWKLVLGHFFSISIVVDVSVRCFAPVLTANNLWMYVCVAI